MSHEQLVVHFVGVVDVDAVRDGAARQGLGPEHAWRVVARSSRNPTRRWSRSKVTTEAKTVRPVRWIAVSTDSIRASPGGPSTSASTAARSFPGRPVKWLSMSTTVYECRCAERASSRPQSGQVHAIARACHADRLPYPASRSSIARWAAASLCSCGPSRICHGSSPDRAQSTSRSCIQRRCVSNSRISSRAHGTSRSQTR